MVAWIGIAHAMTVAEVPDPRRRGRWVADAAEVIGERDEAALNEQLAALHRDLHVDVAIVAVPTVDDTPAAFADDLFDRWGIGDARADNGLLVLVVIDERRTEMVTGEGLDAVLPDPYLVEVQERHLVPRFARRKFGLGLREGMASIERRLRDHPDDARLGVDGPAARAAAGWVWSAAVLAGVVGVVGVGIGAGVVASDRRRRRAPQTCATCAVTMSRLGGAAARAHLTPGQQSEQALGSVYHQVHQCPKCRQVHTIAVPSWVGGITKCPACRNLTLTTHRERLAYATYTSGGQERVTEQCHHCGATTTELRVSAPRRHRRHRRHHPHGGGEGGAGTSW